MMQERIDWEIKQGDCLEVLRGLASDSIDAVITDPPYSSGGFSRDDKGLDVDTKYQSGGAKKTYPSFSGDSRDQRGYLAWCSIWMTEAYRVLKPGGYLLAFSDWRQLPVMTDALQAGGIFWRGIISWDKGPGSRAPHKGYFRHQCEYVAWGTKGKATMLEHDGPFPGSITCPIHHQDKHHLTGKPVPLMKELVRCVKPGGIVFDPFAGSGTTGVACVTTGRRFLGVEREAEYVKIAIDRLRNAERTGSDCRREDQKGLWSDHYERPAPCQPQLN